MDKNNIDLENQVEYLIYIFKEIIQNYKKLGLIGKIININIYRKMRSILELLNNPYGVAEKYGLPTEEVTPWELNIIKIAFNKLDDDTKEIIDGLHILMKEKFLIERKILFQLDPHEMIYLCNQILGKNKDIGLFQTF